MPHARSRGLKDVEPPPLATGWYELHPVYVQYDTSHKTGNEMLRLVYGVWDGPPLADGSSPIGSEAIDLIMCSFTGMKDNGRYPRKRMAEFMRAMGFAGRDPLQMHATDFIGRLVLGYVRREPDLHNRLENKVVRYKPSPKCEGFAARYGITVATERGAAYSRQPGDGTGENLPDPDYEKRRAKKLESARWRSAVG